MIDSKYNIHNIIRYLGKFRYILFNSHCIYKIKTSCNGTERQQVTHLNEEL